MFFITVCQIMKIRGFKLKISFLYVKGLVTVLKIITVHPLFKSLNLHWETKNSM